MHLLPQTQLQNGKYRIIEKIGQGGFGIIYKAFHRDLDCEVCIKEFFYRDLCERKSDSTHITVVSTSAEKIEMVKSLHKKFFKEAQRLGQFRSANIIQVMDCFEENSTAYFVMEYINGGSLEQYLETNGKLSEPKAKEIIVPIIKALGLVHDKGLLHLDIKPANIMIRQDESSILIDFGISKYFDVDGGHTTTAPIGISKGFAPIEQYGGNVADFSKATDIYSLCAMLYRMVTGINPPEPLMVMQKGIESPRKLNASLSIAFSELIVKGISVNKSDRPQKVEELLESMGEIIKPTIPKPKVEEPKPSIEKTDDTTELIEKPKEESKIDFSYVQPNHTIVDDEVSDEKKSSNFGWIAGIIAGVAISVIIFFSNSNSNDGTGNQVAVLPVSDSSLVVPSQASDSVEVAPDPTSLTDDERLIIGDKSFGSHWIDGPGEAIIRKIENEIYIVGRQVSTSGNDSCIIDGKIKMIDNRNFRFNGEISLTYHYTDYETSQPKVEKKTLYGEQVFRRFGKRPYWRLKQPDSGYFVSCCHYIDISM